MSEQRVGNCYATSEAVYHLLGGKAAGWKPMRIPIYDHKGFVMENHWFLQHESGMILDLTKSQYDTEPDYSKAIGCGFLTKEPSYRGREMMEKLVWTE